MLKLSVGNYHISTYGEEKEISLSEVYLKKGEVYRKVGALDLMCEAFQEACDFKNCELFNSECD